MFELPSAEYHTLTTFIVTNTNGTVHNVHPEASVQESVSQLGTLPLCRRPFHEESASATPRSLMMLPLHSLPNTLRSFACRGSVIEKTPKQTFQSRGQTGSREYAKPPPSDNVRQPQTTTSIFDDAIGELETPLFSSPLLIVRREREREEQAQYLTHTCATCCLCLHVWHTGIQVANGSDGLVEDHHDSAV